MTITERNETFIECQNLIGFTIRKNMLLIRALHLDIEDVRQELSIKALKSIEDYNPDKNMKLSNYILSMLQYEILNIRNYNNRHCRSANTSTISLDCAYCDEDGEEQGIEIPVTVEYESDIVAKETLGMLLDGEKDALAKRMSGVGLTDKRQKKYMDRVKKKFVRYYRAANV